MSLTRKNLLRAAGALSLLLTTGLTGCATTRPTETEGRRTYVLIHGAWSDSSAWAKVTPLLEKEGHKVIAVDLPAHGSDTTPAAETSLQGYADKVVKVLDAEPGQVILVGHSMGGMVVSQAAEQRPDKVRKLVYLAAFLLRSGESVYQMGQTDTESRLHQYFLPSEDGKTLGLKPEALTDAFCPECSAADLAAVGSRPAPLEPTGPLGTPVQVTEAAWGRVPRIYIETLRDRALGPAIQKRMYTTLPVERVIPMDAGHAPFLTHPEVLAQHLLSL